MAEAFHSAWDLLTLGGNAQDPRVNVQSARETLALRIIEAAKAGERDATRLRDDALAYLTNLSVQKRARS
jgi:hypothetical protein